MTSLRKLILLSLSLFLCACQSPIRIISLDRTGTRVNSIVVDSPYGGARGEIWSLSDTDQKDIVVAKNKSQVNLFDRTTWLGSIQIQGDQMASINSQLSPAIDWKAARRQPLPADGKIRLADILGPDAALSAKDRDLQLITRYLEPLRRMKTANTTTEALAGSDNRTFITWSMLGSNRFKIRMISFLEHSGMMKEFFFRDDQLIATHTQFCKRSGDHSTISEDQLVTQFSVDRYYKDGKMLESFVLPGLPSFDSIAAASATQPASQPESLTAQEKAEANAALNDIFGGQDSPQHTRDAQFASWLMEHWGKDQLNLESWIMQGKP